MMMAVLVFTLSLVLVSLFFSRKRREARVVARFLNRPELKVSLERLNAIYADVNAFEISKEARDRSKLYDNAFVYGEIDLPTFAAILTQVSPKPHEIFYDLGSGAGKAVLLTALLYPESTAIGIEYLAEFIDLSERLRKELGMTNAQFIHGDYFKIDISKADIIFINATGLFGDDLIKLRQRLDCVKPGARIILTSKRLSPQTFEEMYSGQVQMSWGPCSLMIYRKY